MAQQKDRGNAVLGAGAIMASAVALLNSGKVSAGELDEATRQLILAIAQNSAATLESVNAILEQLSAGGEIKGYAPNSYNIRVARLFINNLTLAIHLPSINIPDDTHLLIKAWPANVGLIYVGNSATSVIPTAGGIITDAWPLLPNEIVGYKLKNSNTVYIGGNTIGDSFVISVEQA